jgi:beta-lactamase superfamily II metal-dependent hydrolase
MTAGGYLASFLTERKVSRIDHVVLTHPHADHYTGLMYVFTKLSAGNFYDTRMDNPRTSFDEAVRKKASEAGAVTVYPSDGDTLSWDPSVQVRVLHSCPEPQSSELGRTVNDCSIVLRLTYHGTSMLLTGDIQDDVEDSLVAEYGAGLKADLLKVGHHGSAYSSTAGFLSAVRPRHAVISVGADNNYGHPAPGCMLRLQDAGAEVSRTDLDGTVEYSIP